MTLKQKQAVCAKFVSTLKALAYNEPRSWGWWSQRAGWLRGQKATAVELQSKDPKEFYQWVQQIGLPLPEIDKLIAQCESRFEQEKTVESWRVQTRQSREHLWHTRLETYDEHDAQEKYEKFVERNDSQVQLEKTSEKDNYGPRRDTYRFVKSWTPANWQEIG